MVGKLKPTIVVIGIALIVVGMIVLTHSETHSGCETVRSDGSLTTQCGELTYQPYFWPGGLLAAAGIFVSITGLDMYNSKDKSGEG